MRKLAMIFALSFLGLCVQAPARALLPTVTVTVQVYNWYTLQRQPGAAVRLDVIYPGMIRQTYNGIANAQGEVSFPLYAPAIPAPWTPAVGFGATATFNMGGQALTGTNSASTPLPTNPTYILPVVMN